MITKNVILEKYLVRGTNKGGELLLHHTDAIDLIEDCKRSGIVILGLDFYTETNQGILEVSSADFSDISEQPNAAEKTIVAAKSLIRETLPDGAIWVSFVLSSE